MSEQNLREAIQNYRELQRLAEDLEQEMETVKDTIKAELSRQGVDELTAGEYKVRWTVVKSSDWTPAHSARRPPNFAKNSPDAWKQNAFPLREGVRICLHRSRQFGPSAWTAVAALLKKWSCVLSRIAHCIRIGSAKIPISSCRTNRGQGGRHISKIKPASRAHKTPAQPGRVTILPRPKRPQRGGQTHKESPHIRSADQAIRI